MYENLFLNQENHFFQSVSNLAEFILINVPTCIISQNNVMEIKFKISVYFKFISCSSIIPLCVCMYVFHQELPIQ